MSERSEHDLPGLQARHGTEMRQDHCPELIRSRNNVRVFTLPEYLAQVKKISKGLYDGGGDEWDMGVSMKRAAKYATEGHNETAADMVGWLDNYTLGSTSGMAWVSCIAGARVCVPDYLSGSPRYMRKRAKTEKMTQHVTVWVECISSAGITADMLRNRGLAILAFVESLRRLRISVELNLMCALPTDLFGIDWSPKAHYGVVHHVIKLDTNPLDLSTSGFCLSHPAWYRNVMYSVGRELDQFNGGCPPGQEHAKFDEDGMYKSDETYEPYVRERLGMGQDDVYIPLPNYQDKMLADPRAWLNNKLQPYLGGVQ